MKLGKHFESPNESKTHTKRRKTFDNCLNALFLQTIKLSKQLPINYSI